MAGWGASGLKDGNWLVTRLILLKSRKGEIPVRRVTYLLPGKQNPLLRYTLLGKGSAARNGGILKASKGGRNGSMKSARPSHA